MKTLLFRSLTGGVAIVVMIGLIVNNHIDSEDLDTTMREVKALKIELTGVRSNLSTLKAEHEKFETNVFAQIRKFDHASESDSSSLIATEQNSDIDVEPIDAQDSSVDDDGSQEDRLAEMDNTLNTQKSDPIWDDDAAGQIINSFSNAGFKKNQLQAVVCRGIICRVEIDQDEEIAISELFEGEQQLIPWSHKGRIETIENEAGDFTTVMYITREDYDFPNNF